MERIYKYYPEDFGELTVNVIHMDLLFDVYDDHTYVSSDLKVRTLGKPIESLDLNCRDLDIKKVSCKDHDVSHEYRADNHILSIEFESSTCMVFFSRTHLTPKLSFLWRGIDVSPSGRSIPLPE